MGKYKIIDKNDKHSIGKLSVDTETLKEKLRKRIIAGVCLTLMVGSSLGATFETLKYLKEEDNHDNDIVYESVEDNASMMVACIRVESEVHDLVDKMDKTFDGFSSEDYQEFKELCDAKDEYNEIKNEINNISVLPQNRVFESKMMRIRDGLTELFDNINDFIQKMEEDKKKFKEMLEFDKKKRAIGKQRPKDADYKEKENLVQRL